jgi:hypothetical protein
LSRPRVASAALASNARRDDASWLRWSGGRSIIGAFFSSVCPGRCSARSSDGSVTRWFGPLQAGDPTAVEQLWQRYYHRLAGLARTKLPGAVRRVADEEDVASSALASFCRRAGEGRFPDVRDRDSLWRLVAVLKMEGHSNEEIGDRLGVADRTVKRRLESIRKVWRARGGGG